MLERQFEARDVIYHEGDPGDAVFVIQDGSVEVMRDVAGSELRLAILDKGEIFGEMGVINEQPRSTTVCAVEKTRLVAISKDDFLKIFSKEKPMALRILRLLCGRILRVDDQLVSQKLYSDATRQTDALTCNCCQRRRWSSHKLVRKAFWLTGCHTTSAVVSIIPGRRTPMV